MSLQIASTSEPQILVIGGGFGGIAVAESLRDAKATVILVDRANHHLFQPLLYQVATGILASSDIATPLRHIFRKQKNVSTFLGEVTSIDLAERSFCVDGRLIPTKYDYLVIAAGSEQSYFGHDEFAPFAPGLKSLSDAEYLRNRILGAFENAERQLDPAVHPELTTFVLVGGGPTGVELAGAICEMARRTLASEFRRYDPTKLRVVLVQGGDRILPQFPPKTSAAAKARLEKLGVEVRLKSHVTKVDAEGVLMGEERIASRNVIWTAGVSASPLVKSLGLPADHSERIIVQGDCSVAGHPEVFVIGDAAAFTPPGGKPLPGVAQVALQQGHHVGRTIRDRIKNRPAQAPFKYFDKGNLAVIGRFYAVMDAFGVRSNGLFAFLIWAFVHIEFLSSALNRLRTGVQWVWVLFTHERADCLIIPPKDPSKG